jgi:hypothetical protein
MALVRDIDAGTLTLGEFDALTTESEGAAKLSKIWANAKKQTTRKRK